MEWTAEHVRFFLDGRSVRTVEQSIHYEMQFMLGVYRFGEPTVPDGQPARFTVDRFRAYRPVEPRVPSITSSRDPNGDVIGSPNGLKRPPVSPA